MFDDFGFFLSVMLAEEDRLQEEEEELEYWQDDDCDDEEDWDAGSSRLWLCQYSLSASPFGLC